MKTLISGSLAYDSIMVFEDQFKNHILPEQIHILNVSFFTPSMRRYMGGCAGNIAYTLKLLGGDPLIMATVGEDFGPYTKWLETNKLATDHVTTVPDTFTAQAFIITDLDNNQINSFHPGAMMQAHLNKVDDASGVEIGIVAPDGRDAMIEHAQQFAEANIPFIFDPGQGLPMFEGEDLMTFIDQATYAVLNDYESQMLCQKTGKTIEDLASQLDALIVTKGGEGSVVYQNGGVSTVPAAPISEAVDPTGCGDSYRAGLLFGLSQGFDMQVCAKLGAICGAIKIESAGTQNHSFTFDSFKERYQRVFGESF